MDDGSYYDCNASHVSQQHSPQTACNQFERLVISRAIMVATPPLKFRMGKEQGPRHGGRMAAEIAYTTSCWLNRTRTTAISEREQF
eukprot:scaffold35698_cov63-Attheya_sp.AAC.16